MHRQWKFWGSIVLGILLSCFFAVAASAAGEAETAEVPAVDVVTVETTDEGTEEPLSTVRRTADDIIDDITTDTALLPTKRLRANLDMATFFLREGARTVKGVVEDSVTNADLLTGKVTSLLGEEVDETAKKAMRVISYPLSVVPYTAANLAIEGLVLSVGAAAAVVMTSVFLLVAPVVGVQLGTSLVGLIL